MAVVPTGPISLPLGRFRTLLSESTNFQTLVGAANAAAALLSVHLVRKASAALPYALVAQAGGWRADRIKQGAAQVQGSGAVRLMIRDSFNPATDPADAELTFTNAIGAIIEDLINQSGTPGDLQITGIDLVDVVQRSADDEKSSQGSYYQAIFDVLWSGSPG